MKIHLTAVGYLTKDTEVSTYGQEAKEKAVFTIPFDMYNDVGYLRIEAFGNKVRYAETLKKGDLVSVHGTLSIKRKDDKTYIHVVAEDITCIKRKNPRPADEYEQEPPQQQTTKQEDDDLPF